MSRCSLPNASPVKFGYSDYGREQSLFDKLDMPLALEPKQLSPWLGGCSGQIPIPSPVGSSVVEAGFG